LKAKVDYVPNKQRRRNIILSRLVPFFPPPFRYLLHNAPLTPAGQTNDRETIRMDEDESEAAYFTKLRIEKVLQRA
jgi:hypothetical protein